MAPRRKSRRKPTTPYCGRLLSNGPSQRSSPPWAPSRTFTCTTAIPLAGYIVRDLDGSNPSRSASVLLVTIWEMGEAAGPLFLTPLSEVFGRYPRHQRGERALHCGLDSGRAVPKRLRLRRRPRADGPGCCARRAQPRHHHRHVGPGAARDRHDGGHDGAAAGRRRGREPGLATGAVDERLPGGRMRARLPLLLQGDKPGRRRGLLSRSTRAATPGSLCSDPSSSCRAWAS